jgi:hypothetical protein
LGVYTVYCLYWDRYTGQIYSTWLS